MADAIVFDAVVQKVQTLVDFGLRITLDLPETAIVAAAQMMAIKREGQVLHIVATPEKQMESGKENGEISKRAIRKSSRSTT